MKNLMKSLVLFALIIGISAHAIFDPTWERPIYQADLTQFYTHEMIRFPIAQHLVMHQRDGSQYPTMFTLTEDTGLRCIQAPCPGVVVKSKFRVVKVDELSQLVTRFVAKEMPKVGPFGMPVVSRRTLVVHQGNYLRMQWNVRVIDNKGPQQYVGYPEGVITIE